MLFSRSFLSVGVCVLFVLGLAAAEDSAPKAEKKAVKIVEAPVVSRAYYSTYNSKALTARVSPVSVRGPEGLRFLNSTCLSMTEADYKYEVCPFQNVTQHEQTSRWNAYKGVLGVFQGWKIINGSFYSMVMLDGDACGSSGAYRQAEIVFICGVEHKLLKVTEPSTCHYQVTYQTPLACNSTLMAVYYLLNSSQQQTWRETQELFYHNEITFKGVTKRMNDIYLEAGLLPAARADDKKDQHKDDSSTKSSSSSSSSSQFSNMGACVKAYSDLEEKVKKLEAELALLRPNKSANATLHANTTHVSAGGHQQNKTNATTKVQSAANTAAASDTTVHKASPHHSDLERSTPVDSDRKASDQQQVKAESQQQQNDHQQSEEDHQSAPVAGKNGLGGHSVDKGGRHTGNGLSRHSPPKSGDDNTKAHPSRTLRDERPHPARDNGNVDQNGDTRVHQAADNPVNSKQVRAAPHAQL